MSSARLPLLVVASGAVLALAGCIPLPPSPTIPPPALPTEAAPEPVQTDVAEPSPSADAGALPEYVDFNTPLEPGTLAGWETSITTDAAFEVQPDSDFPAGPVISVVETATGCTFWAYQGLPDGDSTDEETSSEATLAALVGGQPEELDIFELGPSASQGVVVAFLSAVMVDESTGDTAAFYARNFQSSQSTSSIIAECSAAAGGLDHIDQVVGEQLQLNFLLP